MVRVGRLAGPIVGLRFDSPTCSGVTDETGTFHFRDGEIGKVADPALTNLARFLLALDEDGDPDNGITVTPRVHELVGDRAISFGYRPMSLPGAPADPVRAFADDPVVVGLLQELDQANAFTGATPRVLPSPAAARNEVRRHILGIRRFRDVQIPLRKGSYVYADVFRPDTPDPVPVVITVLPGKPGRVRIREPREHQHRDLGPARLRARARGQSRRGPARESGRTATSACGECRTTRSTSTRWPASGLRTSRP